MEGGFAAIWCDRNPAPMMIKDPERVDRCRLKNTNLEYRNPKRFDKLTALSKVEGQIRNSNGPMTKTNRHL